MSQSVTKVGIELVGQITVVDVGEELKYTLSVLQIDVYSTGTHCRLRKFVESWLNQNNSIS